MNMCEAFVKGREENHAITRSSWGKNEKCHSRVYIYHGMDNLLSLVQDDVERGIFHICAADALADDWVLVDEQPYHGPLKLPEKVD